MARPRVLALPRGSALLRHGDFLRLWSAQTLSQLGGQVGVLAIPLVAISTLRASAFEVALMATAGSLPFLLFSLPVGVWVDRLPRRPILVAATVGRAVALASIPLAHLLDALTIWQLYATAFATGTLTVFFDVAYQSYLPSLVQRDQLQEANSKLELSQSGARVGGPGFAGLLVEAVTAPFAVAVDVGALAGSALLLTRIRREERRVEIPPAAHGRRGARMLREIGEGLRFVLRHPYMAPNLLFVATTNFFTSGMFAILLVYAVRELGLSAAEVGLAFTLGNAGFLAGALAAARAPALIGGIGRTLLVAAAATGWGWLLVPLAPAEAAMPFLAAATALYWFAAIVYNVIFISLSQAVTPDRLLGRMTASRRFVVWGINSLGALAAGAVTNVIDLRTTLWIGAAGASLAFLPLLLSQVRSVRTLPDAAAALALEPDRQPAAT
jgi:MFS family permease